MAKIRIVGDSSGYVELAAPNAAGNNTLELPSSGTRLVGSDNSGNVSISGIVTAATFSGNVNSTSGVTTVTSLRATSIVGVTTAGITTAYINTLSGISTISASSAISINQNLVFASGKGIDFSAASNAAGMTGELLSDYEEGTWTPIDGSGSGLTFSNTSGNCFYTKIGRMVYASFRVTYPSTSSTEIAQIGGLPFTSVTTSQGAQACAVAEHSHSVGTTMIVNANATTMYILTCSSGVTVNTNANVSGKDFRGTAIYHAAA